jgi:hypothetical protein
LGFDVTKKERLNMKAYYKHNWFVTVSTADTKNVFVGVKVVRDFGILHITIGFLFFWVTAERLTPLQSRVTRW